MNLQVENLLKSVSQEIKALTIARQRYATQLAPEFSIFNYIYTDEMMLSRIIADLLNPKGDHAQGEIFLKLFLDIFAIHQKDNEFNLKTAEVTTEVITRFIENSRRMDIYISIPYLNQLGNFGICIENKPYASDQKNQLEDYVKELERRHDNGHWHMIYLTMNGNEPSSYSIKPQILSEWISEKKCSLLAYTELVLWLKQCSLYCQNNNVIFFLKAFEYFINNNFGGAKDMSETESIDNVINQNQDYKEAFEHIYKHGVQMKIKLNNKTSNLKSLFSLEHKKIKVNIAFHARNDFSVLLSCVYFDFLMKNYNVFIDINVYPNRYEITLAERTYQESKSLKLQDILDSLGYKSLSMTKNNRVLVHMYPSETDFHRIHEDVNSLIDQLIDYHLDTSQPNFT